MINKEQVGYFMLDYYSEISKKEVRTRLISKDQRNKKMPKLRIMLTSDYKLRTKELGPRTTLWVLHRTTNPKQSKIYFAPV